MRVRASAQGLAAACHTEGDGRIWASADGLSFEPVPLGVSTTFLLSAALGPGDALAAGGPNAQVILGTRKKAEIVRAEPWWLKSLEKMRNEQAAQGKR